MCMHISICKDSSYILCPQNAPTIVFQIVFPPKVNLSNDFLFFGKKNKKAIYLFDEQ